MNRHLSLRSFEETVTLLQLFQRPSRVERVPVLESVGRVTAKAVISPLTVPEKNISAMDGYAVRSREFFGASERRPVALSNYCRVNTGNVVPPEYDAVVMVEDVLQEKGEYVVRRPARPWQHIRAAGEDIREYDTILPEGYQIRLGDIGALISYGITDVDVQAVRVGLLPTGNELVPRGRRPGPGEVIESNATVAGAYLRDVGATCTQYPITADDPAQLRQAIKQGICENDLLLVSAGSSAGTCDFTADVISELGELLVHGIAVKPGKSAIVGMIDEKPVIGLPGYPGAANTIVRELALPLLAGWGFRSHPGETVNARLTRTLHSDPGWDEFVHLTVARLGHGYIATPQPRGAGMQMTAIRSNGYLHIPADVDGIFAGDEIEVRLTGPRALLHQSLIVSGSYDPSLESLAGLLRKQEIILHANNVGNLGGIRSLRSGGCHAAPLNVPSPEGPWTTDYFKEYFTPGEVTVICVAGVQYGIVSREPMTVRDLTGVQFINHRADSSSRELIDRVLEEQGIDSASVPGYCTEAAGHHAVGQTVRDGIADAGIALYSTARLFGLHFSPVATELYEMTIRNDELGDERIHSLIATISSPAFAQALKAAGGYDTSVTGTVREVV